MAPQFQPSPRSTSPSPTLDADPPPPRVVAMPKARTAPRRAHFTRRIDWLGRSAWFRGSRLASAVRCSGAATGPIGLGGGRDRKGEGERVASRSQVILDKRGQEGRRGERGWWPVGLTTDGRDRLILTARREDDRPPFRHFTHGPPLESNWAGLLACPQQHRLLPLPT